MNREIDALRMQPAQVDDPLDTGSGGRFGDVVGRASLDLFEVALGPHRVHEAANDVLAGARRFDGNRVGEIALDDRNQPGLGHVEEFLRRAHENGDFIPCREQPGDEPATDEPGRPGDQHGFHANVPSLGGVEGRRILHEKLKCCGVNLGALVEVDRASGSRGQAGVEQSGRVIERCALGESELDLCIFEINAREERLVAGEI